MIKGITLLISKIWRRVQKTWWKHLFLHGHQGTLIYQQKPRISVPVAANGKGQVHIGEHTHLGYDLAPKQGNGTILLQARNTESSIRIGSHTKLSNNVSLIACKQITIGHRCLIGDSVIITDSDFHEILPEQRHEGGGATAPVVIGDNVWLGSRVMILKGVTIGDGSVIAAGSVVVKNIPARALAAGTPAQLIRHI